MSWKFTTAQRIRTAASLGIVFLLILATNLIDSNHFTLVQNSLTTVYEDRLLAKNYLYKISRKLQTKQHALEHAPPGEVLSINQTANDSIQVLVEWYASTKLTDREAKLFTMLQRDIVALLEFEESFTKGEVVNAELPSLSASEPYYTKIFKGLDDLSDIQVGEGRRELGLSNRFIENSNFIAKLEIAALVLIGIVLQFVIFVRPMKTSRIQEDAF